MEPLVRTLDEQLAKKKCLENLLQPVYFEIMCWYRLLHKNPSSPSEQWLISPCSRHTISRKLSYGYNTGIAAELEKDDHID